MLTHAEIFQKQYAVTRHGYSQFLRELEKDYEDVITHFENHPTNLHKNEESEHLLQTVVEFATSDKTLERVFDFLSTEAKSDNELSEKIISKILFGALQNRANFQTAIVDPKKSFFLDCDKNNKSLFEYLGNFLTGLAETKPKLAVEYFFSAASAYLSPTFKPYYGENMKNFIDKTGGLITQENNPFPQELPASQMQFINQICTKIPGKKK